MSGKKKIDYEDQAIKEIIAALTDLDKNPGFNTNPFYTSDIERYPNNYQPFVDKHIEYLVNHPNTDPYQYISNLKIKSKII